MECCKHNLWAVHGIHLSKAIFIGTVFTLNIWTDSLSKADSLEKKNKNKQTNKQ